MGMGNGSDPDPKPFPVANPGTRYYCITVTTISFKVSLDEARDIRSRARRERLTVSEYLRRQAVAPARPSPAIRQTICPLTGATIFSATDDLPPLTVESTREMLADFP